MEILWLSDRHGATAATVVDLLRARGHHLDCRPLDERMGTFLRSAHVILLDLNIPELDGLRILHGLRAISAVPLIVLAPRRDENSVVRWLGAGADDYLAKPVQVRELVARVEALGRRAGTGGNDPQSVVEVKDLSIDLNGRTVKVGDKTIQLTSKEFSVLSVLASRAGYPVSRRQIMDEVWGEARIAVSRTLGVHMVTLRAKLDRPGLLQTVHGFGYRLG
jgi:DNA-binding response OmpR family regulator